MARCRALAKKYFACMPLLLELGTLYVNHSNLAPPPRPPGRVWRKPRPSSDG